MSSSSYWRKREADQLAKNIIDEAQYTKAINNYYDYMLDMAQKEINEFYTRYAKTEGISMAEAKKRVSQLDMNAYERKAAKYVKDKTFTKEANDEMRLYNATMKINRLELLKANIGLELVDGFDDLQKYFDQILTGRTLAEFSRQSGILGSTIANSEKAAHAIVNASFHNAKFSDRLWLEQDVLKSELSKLLRQGLIQGKHPRVLAKQLRNLFDAGRDDALRLMRTELARVQIEAQRQSYERNGYEEYVFIAEPTACKDCAALDNGKPLKVKDMMPGTNAPPIHPNCRCSTAAYMDREEFDKWLENQENYAKLEETTDKWSKEARKELLMDEKVLSGRQRETAVIYDSKGKVLFQKRGSENEVRFTIAEFMRLKGSIITHNHPSGASFSYTDIKLLRRSRAQEIRAATESGVYYMRQPARWDSRISSTADMKREYQKIRNSVRSKYQALYEAGKITKAERHLLSSNEYNKLFSEKYGIDYGKDGYYERGKN